MVQGKNKALRSQESMSSKVRYRRDEHIISYNVIQMKSKQTKVADNNVIDVSTPALVVTNKVMPRLGI